MLLLKRVLNRVFFKIFLIFVSTSILWLNFIVFSLIILKIEPGYSGLIPAFVVPSLLVIVFQFLPMLSIVMSSVILFVRNRRYATIYLFALITFTLSMLLGLFDNRESFLLQSNVEMIDSVTNVSNSSVDTVIIDDFVFVDSDYSVFTPPDDFDEESVIAPEYELFLSFSKFLYKSYRFVLKFQVVVSTVFLIFSLLLIFLFRKKK